MANLISVSNMNFSEYFNLLIHSAGYLKLTEFELNKDYYEKGIINKKVYENATTELLKFYNLNNQ
jgi:hypothetical protein